MNQLFRFVLFLSPFLYVVIQANEFIVTIPQGKLHGTKFKSRNGTEHRAFFSIPYAKPPIGELRFQSPQKPVGWEGVRNASILPDSCPQRVNFTTLGEEDCLYLNVYTPFNVNSSSNLPVLVFIHGGAFSIGAGLVYRGEYFMDYRILFITFEYRLGPLGFLSTGDSIMPGNYGMKDQVAALKWIQENIAAFGGNPNLVTIIGSSSGGSSVHHHLYSPLSAGLFQRAISQSGSAFSLDARFKPDVIRQKTIAFGILVGCPAAESSEILLQCLRKVPVEELVFANEKFYFLPTFDPMVHFSIVPEPTSVADAFIYQDPLTGNPTSNVPWLAGINSADGATETQKLAAANGLLLEVFNQNYERFLPVMLDLVDWVDSTKSEEVVKAAKKFYFDDEEITLATIKNLTDMFTDFSFFYPTYEGMSQYTGSVYLYYYDHKNQYTFADTLDARNSIDLGVFHGDELISFFYMPYLFPLKIVSGPDFNVSKRMLERWISFAQTGNPSIGGKPWDPFVASEVNYLHITSTKDEMKKKLLADRILFWKNTLPLPSAASSDKFRSSRMGICISLWLLFHLLS